MKVYDIIIRVSSMGGRDERDESTVTIEDQRRRARDQIKRLGGRVGIEHSATDVSGFAATESAQYLTALERVRSRQADGAVVGYSSRFSRNSRGGGHYFNLMEQAGGEIWFADKPDLDYRTPSGRFETGLDLLLNERYYFETKVKGDRVARLKIDEQGVPNACPFGYRRNGTFLNGVLTEKVDADKHPKALVPDPETAPIVRRIFQNRSAGHGWTRIAQALNADGVPAPRGGQWSVSTVRSITRCETYLGVAQYKRRNGRRGKPTGEVLRHENAHRSLVTRPLWLAAQSSTTVQRTGRYQAGVAGGLARCSGCGGVLSVAGTEPYLTYGCRRQSNGGRCSQPVHITKRIVDEYVDAWVVKVLVGGIGRAPGSDLGTLRDTAMAAGEELAAYVEAAAAVKRDIFERGLQVRQKKLDLATAALDAEELKTSLVHELPTASVYANAPLEDKRRIARALIERVIVDPVGIGAPVSRLRLVER